MPRIILIETSTSLCSTALIEGEDIVSRRESTDQRAQAALTAPFVKEMLDECDLKVKDCDAVCVSCGPGSYTGLRVGVSTAKGLCFGAGIPLIAVSTLDLLAFQAVSKGLPEGCRTIIPMIDARRMEVYAAVYSPEGVRESEIEPRIIDAGSFAGRLAEGPCVFIGDGAAKSAEAIGSPSVTAFQECPVADSMLIPALRAFKEKRFENTAYFEPFYLKNYVARISGNKIF